MATDADKNKARKTIIKRHNKANKQASMWQHLAKNKQTNNQNLKRSKRTTPGIPTWSPTVVLTWPDSA